MPDGRALRTEESIVLPVTDRLPPTVERLGSEEPWRRASA